MTVEALESRQLLSLYFVAGGTGSGGDGSFLNPWQSIALVNANIAAGKILPGDSLDFQSGNVYPGTLLFDGHGGAPGAPIRILDYGPSAALPIIQAGNGSGISVRGAGYFDISDLELVGNYDPVLNPSTSDGNGMEFIDTNLSNLAGISIHNVTIHGFGELPGEKASGDTGCGIIFYDGVNRPASGYAYQSITISQCEISNCNRSGIELWDDRSDALDPYSQLMYSGVEIDHVKIHDIITPRPAPGTNSGGGEGILLESVEGAVVQRCQVYNDGSLLDQNGNRLFIDEGVGIWCNHSDHVLFQYNEVHDNHSQTEGDEGGFAFGRWTTNSIMQYNYSHDNDGYGYMLESNNATQLMPENDILRFNISENDSRQSRYGALLFESWAASNIYVYNNTFYLSDNGLADSSNGNFFVAPAIRFDADDSAPVAAPQIYVYNNIFFTASSTAGTTIPVVLVESEFPTSGLTFQGNDYFGSGPGGFEIDWAGMTFTSFSSWGQDPRGASVDPVLGFEYVTGTNHTVSAETVQNIDTMATQLSVLFQLTGATPNVIRTGGVNLAAAINPNWWLPDGYNWGGACGPAADLWGYSVPDAYGWYSMGVCQF